VQGAYFSHMSNPKFHVWQGSELRASFYSSDNKELSITDKQKICEILKTPFESAWFAPTKESILTVWLPEKANVHNPGREKILAFKRKIPSLSIEACPFWDSAMKRPRDEQ
jgi:hypothetical protein